MQKRVDQDNLLYGALSWQERPKPSINKFGDVTTAYLGASADRLRKNALVVDAWNQVLPGELRLHCRLTEISESILYVDVEPGPYMHELRVISAELLEYLRNSCSKKIKKIVLRPMRT